MLSNPNKIIDRSTLIGIPSNRLSVRNRQRWRKSLCVTSKITDIALGATKRQMLRKEHSRISGKLYPARGEIHREGKINVKSSTCISRLSNNFTEFVYKIWGVAFGSNSVLSKFHNTVLQWILKVQIPFSIDLIL